MNEQKTKKKKNTILPTLDFVENSGKNSLKENASFEMKDNNYDTKKVDLNQE